MNSPRLLDLLCVEGEGGKEGVESEDLRILKFVCGRKAGEMDGH